jgi:hypothetical protein
LNNIADTVAVLVDLPVRKVVEEVGSDVSCSVYSACLLSDILAIDSHHELITESLTQLRLCERSSFIVAITFELFPHGFVVALNLFRTCHPTLTSQSVLVFLPGEHTFKVSNEVLHRGDVLVVLPLLFLFFESLLLLQDSDGLVDFLDLSSDIFFSLIPHFLHALQMCHDLNQDRIL